MGHPTIYPAGVTDYNSEKCWSALTMPQALEVGAVVNGDTWLAGLTDFAQDPLEEVIFIDLPAVDTHFEQGDSCAEIESAKVVSQTVIPLSGTAAEINPLWRTPLS